VAPPLDPPLQQNILSNNKVSDCVFKADNNSRCCCCVLFARLFSLFLSADAPCVPDFAQLSAENGEMENCTCVESFDYFSGSETAYVLTIFFVLGSVIRKCVADD